MSGKAHIPLETLNEWSIEFEGSRECIERLAEFASEQASDAEAYHASLDDLLYAHRQGRDGEVEMWRGLCHSRAVQLNEAYEKIAKLEDEVKFLQLTIDDMIVGESIK